MKCQPSKKAVFEAREIPLINLSPPLSQIVTACRKSAELFSKTPHNPELGKQHFHKMHEVLQVVVAWSILQAMHCVGFVGRVAFNAGLWLWELPGVGHCAGLYNLNQRPYCDGCCLWHRNCCEIFRLKSPVNSIPALCYLCRDCAVLS